MGCSRSVAMAMIVSLFCSQMSDIPEGSDWVVQAGWEGLIRIANGRQVLCLLCVSILETIRRIKALSWRDGTEARWASLVGTTFSVLAALPPSPHFPTLLFSSLCCPLSWSTLSCVEVLKYVNTAGARERETETLHLVHSIICSVVNLSHSWETLNMLHDSERAGDRHKYQRQSAEGLKFCMFAHEHKYVMDSWLLELLQLLNYFLFISSKFLLRLFFPPLNAACFWWGIYSFSAHRLRAQGYSNIFVQLCCQAL